MPPHPLTNFEIQRYYQNESKFNDVYSGNNLPKIKKGAYIINLNKCKSIGTHWIALCVSGNNVTYFDSFGVEYIPKEIKKFISNKSIKINIYINPANDSNWILLHSIYYFYAKRYYLYTSLFSPNEYESNYKIKE